MTRQVPPLYLGRAHVTKVVEHGKYYDGFIYARTSHVSILQIYLSWGRLVVQSDKVSMKSLIDARSSLQWNILFQGTTLVQINSNKQ